MPPTPAPAPSATGNLTKTPFAHLLVYMHERALDGTIAFIGPSGSRHEVYFSRGAPAKANTAFAVTHLGRVLLELGFIDEATLDSSLATLAKTRELHGELLVSLGKLDRAQLVAGLREQLLRRLVVLFEKLGPDTRYEFWAGANLLEDFGGPELTPVDPMRALWTGVRAQGEGPQVEAALSRLGAAPLAAAPGIDPSRFDFGPEERAALEVLRARPAPVAELLEMRLMPERSLKLLLYVLLITRNVVLAQRAPGVAAPSFAPLTAGSGTVPPAGLHAAMGAPGAARAGAHGPPPSSVPGPAPPKEPPRDDAKLAERRQAILSRVETIEKQTFFEVLDVPANASAAALQSAYFALAKQLHPDRLPPELADVREAAAKVFARVSEAFQTLSDPERRAGYQKLLEQGAATTDEQEKVQRIVHAALDYQKAEVFFKKKDLEQAGVFALRAFEADPDQADYTVLYAWLLANRPENLEKRQFDESLRLLNAALEQTPQHERALFYRGSLLKMLGKLESAHRDFQQVVEINPRHIDAAREVRLREMRASSSKQSARAKKEASRPADKPKPGDTGDRKIDWTKDGVGDIVNKLFKK